MTCTQCGHASTLSEKFCSQCGWPVDPVQWESRQVAVAADLSLGLVRFGEGKFSEALALAESVLAADPDHVPALALKGDSLERLGDLDSALACYENVVTLRPDSPLDRIRVAQLKKAVAQPLLAVGAKPDKRNSWITLAALAVLLGSVGSAFAILNRPDTSVQHTTKEPANVASTPFTSPAPVPSKPKTNGLTEAGGQPTDPYAKPEDKKEPDKGTVSTVTKSTAVPYTGTRLPDMSSPDSGYRPVTPEVEVTPEASRPKKDTEPNDPKPNEVQPSGAPKTGEKPPAPIIDIKPSQPDPKTVGGSEERDEGGNESTALIRVARRHFLAGDYDKAAKSYERAIRLGAGTASAYHRLAQCYVNLKQRPDALGAYEKALNGYQRLLDGGVGDRRLYESYIEECRQAIKLLQ